MRNILRALKQSHLKAELKTRRMRKLKTIPDFATSRTLPVSLMLTRESCTFATCNLYGKFCDILSHECIKVLKLFDAYIFLIL